MRHEANPSYLKLSPRPLLSEAAKTTVCEGYSKKRYLGPEASKNASPERFEHSRAKHNRLYMRTVAGDPVNHSGKVTICSQPSFLLSQFHAMISGGSPKVRRGSLTMMISLISLHSLKSIQSADVYIKADAKAQGLSQDLPHLRSLPHPLNMDPAPTRSVAQATLVGFLIQTMLYGLYSSHMVGSCIPT